MDYEIVRIATMGEIEGAKLFIALHSWILEHGTSTIDWQEIGNICGMTSENAILKFTHFRDPAGQLPFQYPPIPDYDPNFGKPVKFPDTGSLYEHKKLDVRNGEVEKFRRALLILPPWAFGVQEVIHMLGYHHDFPGDWGSISKFVHYMDRASYLVDPEIGQKFRDYWQNGQVHRPTATDKAKREVVETFIKEFDADDDVFPLHTLSRNIVPYQHTQSYYMVKYRRGNLLDGYGNIIREVMSDYEISQVWKYGLVCGFDFENLEPNNWDTFLETFGIDVVDGAKDFFTMGVPRHGLLRRYLNPELLPLNLGKNVMVAYTVIYHSSCVRTYASALAVMAQLGIIGMINRFSLPGVNIHHATFLFILSVLRASSEEFFTSEGEFRYAQDMYAKDIMENYRQVEVDL